MARNRTKTSWEIPEVTTKIDSARKWRKQAIPSKTRRNTLGLTILDQIVFFLFFVTKVAKRVNNQKVADFRSDFQTENVSLRPRERYFTHISHCGRAVYSL